MREKSRKKKKLTRERKKERREKTLPRWRGGYGGTSR